MGNNTGACAFQYICSPTFSDNSQTLALFGSVEELQEEMEINPRDNNENDNGARREECFVFINNETIFCSEQRFDFVYSLISNSTSFQSIQPRRVQTATLLYSSNVSCLSRINTCNLIYFRTLQQNRTLIFKCQNTSGTDP